MFLAPFRIVALIAGSALFWAQACDVAATAVGRGKGEEPTQGPAPGNSSTTPLPLDSPNKAYKTACSLSPKANTAGLTVALSNPAADLKLAVPALRLVRAQVAATAAVARIEFCDGDIQIAVVTSAPYLAAWQRDDAGTSLLYAIVTDVNGHQSRSDVKKVDVVDFQPSRTYVVDGDSGQDNFPGTDLQPLRTVSAALALVHAGERILVRDGVYRESLTVPNSAAGTDALPTVIEAEHLGKSVIDAMDPLTGWSADPHRRSSSASDPIYTTRWTRVFSGNIPHDTCPIGCPYQVAFHDVLLKQVMSAAAMVAGSFYIDTANSTLSVWADDKGSAPADAVYASTRSFTLKGASINATHIWVKGMSFRHAATYQQVAGVLTQSDWRLEDVTVSEGNAVGLSIGGDNVAARRVTAINNGEMGWSGGSTRSVAPDSSTYVPWYDRLLVDCQTVGNNAKGFAAAWEGGGTKFTRTDGILLKNFTATGNHGPGLWFDYQNKNFAVEDSMLKGNLNSTQGWEGIGAMFEFNGDGPGRIARNTFTDNQKHDGLIIAESAHVTVEHNSFLANTLGIRSDGRAEPKENLFVDNYFLNTLIWTQSGYWWDGWTKDANQTCQATAAAHHPITHQTVFLNNYFDVSNGNSLLIWSGACQGKTYTSINDIKADFASWPQFAIYGKPSWR